MHRNIRIPIACKCLYCIYCHQHKSNSLISKRNSFQNRDSYNINVLFHRILYFNKVKCFPAKFPTLIRHENNKENPLGKSYKMYKTQTYG